MKEIFDLLNQGWVGSLIGFLGIVFGFVLYKKSKVSAKLIAYINSTKVIGKNNNTPEEIDIFYQGSPVPRVIKSTIVLWNAGNKTIYRSDLVDNDPLRITVSPNEDFISIETNKLSKNAIDFKLTLKSTNKILINFEYLDPNDGAVIDVFHTDEKLNPQIEGTIKGMPKGIKVDNTGSRTNPKTNRLMIFNKPFIFISTFTGLLSIGFFILSQFPAYRDRLDTVVLADSRLALISGVFYLGVGFYGLLATRRKYPKLLESETPFWEKLLLRWIK